MKKLFLVLLAAVMLLSCAAYAEEEIILPDTENATARIGDVEFTLDNEGTYFDFTYKYPAEFQLEIKEETDRVRHLLRWYPDEDYLKPAVGLVISRTKAYSTPEERLTDVAFIDQVTSEEINGMVWWIGVDTDDSNSSVIIWSCAAGGYVYTFSFSSEFPEDFDYAEFARTFVEQVAPVE
ncbi:MAG: hypothetical protein IJK06_00685 [Clostridia bacterium]|nr:hypothetical protein [Clostridia bacterium]